MPIPCYSPGTHNIKCEDLVDGGTSHDYEVAPTAAGDVIIKFEPPAGESMTSVGVDNAASGTVPARGIGTDGLGYITFKASDSAPSGGSWLAEVDWTGAGSAEATSAEPGAIETPRKVPKFKPVLSCGS